MQVYEIYLDKDPKCLVQKKRASESALARFCEMRGENSSSHTAVCHTVDTLALVPTRHQRWYRPYPNAIAQTPCVVAGVNTTHMVTGW
jgi:hypothetical protein